MRIPKELFGQTTESNFKIKLDSWDGHQEVEFERSFVVNIRPAMIDQDSLEVRKLAYETIEYSNKI
jgi:hypothetical protein